MDVRARWMMLLMVGCLVMLTSGENDAQLTTGGWKETRFTTGCAPGPFRPPPDAEPLAAPPPTLGTTPEAVVLGVNLSPSPGGGPRPILGSGFNLEHALWSCQAFREVFRPEILDPFKPAIARVDTGLLPAAPANLPASALGPAVYESVLSSAPYADSWRFFQRLNRAGVRIILGVWGGPAQFTEDGTRLGVLQPAHYDDYVEYVASVVDFLVRRQNIQIWATTIANEPDGGDGNQISPDGLAYIAHRLAPRMAADGVKLYGPDTANGSAALAYLPALLDDPLVARNMAFVGFHEYASSPEVDSVVRFVKDRRPDLPVVITEYTSFEFGDLDDGQEANAQNGFALEIASTLLAHYRAGVDAAIYWDAVDYLQPGHDAITRWGLLRGPSDDFKPRPRYYSLLQILAYLQPGSRVLEDWQEGGSGLHSLSIRTPDGAPVVFLVNQDYDALDLRLLLSGDEANQFPSLAVTRTSRGRLAERDGEVSMRDGIGNLTLPPRSITTLLPATTP